MTKNEISDAVFNHEKWLELISKIREPIYIIRANQEGYLGLASSEEFTQLQTNNEFSAIGILPPLYPEWLGDQAFLTTHGVRFPYIVGEMANGIATAKMVVAAVKAGMLGFFGAAGLMPNVIEENIKVIKQQLNGETAGWGSNLIHSPQEPHLEEAAVNLYLQYQVRRVSASAYMALSPQVVRYAATGLHLDAAGNIQRQNHILAKISRPEVAKQFMLPPPAAMLEQLVKNNLITRDEATLAAKIPVAEDITVEADSGGHTDNRPLNALFSTIQLLAQQVTKENGYAMPIRIGAAGGLGTPSSIAAAFTLGASYVLTGSINQAAVESGLSQEGKQMLAQADIADVMMAPAADMFELGVKLQVLKRGTLFGSRASKLYEYYTRYDSLESIPEAEKTKLEKQVLGANLADIWKLTYDFFQVRDAQQVVRAEQNPKHRMGLVFRWYLGLSSRWAIIGESARKMDYQIWCGPAMGAFNYWVANSFLADLSQRTVAQIGHNLLEGAAVVTRAQQLRSFGLPLSPAAFDYRPRLLG